MTDFPGLPDPAHIHVWSCAWRQGEDGWAETARLWLTDAERGKADGYKVPDDRLRFTAARALLRRLGGAYRGCDGKTMRIENGRSGKPFWGGGHGGLRFNISHSGDWVVLAFSSAFDVGIDVQGVDGNRKTEPLKIARRFFHPAEADALSSCPADEQAALFYGLWACKEAVVKALGEGLHGGLEKFTAFPPGPGAWAAAVFPDAESGPCLFRTLDVDGRHYGALACRTDAPPAVRFFRAAPDGQDTPGG